MKTTIVIPTYWTAPHHQFSSKKESVNVYDHPTFINTTGSLSRLLSSLENLRIRGIHVPRILVLVAVTHKEIEDEAKERVETILEQHNRTLNIISFTPYDLRFLKSHFTQKTYSQFRPFLSLNGYSNTSTESEYD